MLERKRFSPEIGDEYENQGGGFFRCVGYSGGVPVMRNTLSGWEFLAHGPGIYTDGKIDWDYSTGGHFTAIRDFK